MDDVRKLHIMYTALYVSVLYIQYFLVLLCSIYILFTQPKAN